MDDDDDDDDGKQVYRVSIRIYVDASSGLAQRTHLRLLQIFCGLLLLLLLLLL